MKFSSEMSSGWRTGTAWVLLAGALALGACGGAAEDASTPTPGAELAAPAPVGELLATDQLAVFDELYTAISSRYVFEDYGGVDWDAQANALRDRIELGMSEADFKSAMDDLVGLLPDSGSDYMTREERIEFELENTTVYEGIGAFVAVRAEPTPRILLLAVIDGSPAAEAGLEAHDAIYAIDGIPVRAEEGMAVIERVRGPAESTVVLEVASPGEIRRDVTVVRRRLTAADNVRWRLLPSGAVHVLVPVIADASLLEGIGGALQDLDEMASGTGLILDMRVAHSGTDWPLIEMLTFLGHGRLGFYYSRSETSPIAVDGQDILNSQTVPLVILIGPDTQGMPEVFSAVLQESGRAVLVGMRTSGQVLGYERLILPDGSMVVFATSSFETDRGQDLGLAGLAPDILVGADWDQVTLENDPVIEAAEQVLLNSAQ